MAGENSHFQRRQAWGNTVTSAGTLVPQGSRRIARHLPKSGENSHFQRPQAASRCRGKTVTMRATLAPPGFEAHRGKTVTFTGENSHLQLSKSAEALLLQGSQRNRGKTVTIGGKQSLSRGKTVTFNPRNLPQTIAPVGLHPNWGKTVTFRGKTVTFNLLSYCFCRSRVVSYPQFPRASCLLFFFQKNYQQRVTAQEQERSGRLAWDESSARTA